MYPLYRTDQGLAAALLCFNYKLLTTFKDAEERECYVFYYEDEAEDLYRETVRAYYAGTLNVPAKEFRDYEQKLADGSLVDERLGKTTTVELAQYY